MFCPQCGDEFVEGIKKCPDCSVPLVEELPAGEEAPEVVYAEPVTVLETGDPGVLMVAKSILETAGIPYYARGEGVQHLFGAGTFGPGFNPLTGPVYLQVAATDAEAAQALLEDLEGV